MLKVANYWKNFQGMNEQVANNKVLDKKKAIENDFAKFAAKNPMYKDVLSTMDASYKALSTYLFQKSYYSEFIRSVDITTAAFYYTFWQASVEKGDTARAASLLPRIGANASSFMATKNIPLEMETFHDLLEMYINDVPEDQRGAVANKIASKGHKGLDKFHKLVMKKSIFTDSTRLAKFIANPEMKVLVKDPMYALIKDMTDAYNKVQDLPEIVKAKDDLEDARRLFVKGLREMNPKKQYYPNANSTLRLTYGNVLPYSPKDGVMYEYTTTANGILEKEKILKILNLWLTQS